MPPEPLARPPVIRGLTRKADTFDSMMSVLTNGQLDSGVARDRVNEAITLLLQAGRDDPVIRPMLGRAIVLLTEGPSQVPALRRDGGGFLSPVDSKRGS